MSSRSASPSVVIVSCNEGESLRRTAQNLLATLPADGEIVVVDDCSSDGSAECLKRGYGGLAVLQTEQRLGPARARNLGAAHSGGEVVVFSDAHVEAPRDWLWPLAAALDDPQVGAVVPAIGALARPGARGYGMTWSGPDLKATWLGPQAAAPYPIPLMCSCFMAMRRDVFERVGGFDDGLTAYGLEDLELSLRLWLFGYEILVVPRVEIAHQFRPAHPYPVEWKAYLHNLLRVAFVHFSAPRLARVVDAVRDCQAFAEALAMVAASDARARRSDLEARRAYDDEWFFNRFGIAW